MEFMGIKGDRPEGAADGQFCTRRKCRRLRCGVLAAVLAAGLCLGGCQGKNVETMAAFAEKEGTEDGTGAADSVDGEFGMSNESEAETTVDGDTAANPGASTGSVEDAATVKELNRVKVKGIYVSGPMAGTAGMDNLIALVDRTELNALVIDVKNDDGYLTCELDVPLAEQIGSEKHYIKDLPTLVQTCKEKNIYLIARVVAFKDPILAEKMPEWSLHNSDGSIFRDKSGLAWVNPYRKEVWEYLASVGEAAIKAGFDEVQYDYVRFSTDSRMKQVDFGDSTKGRTKTEAISGFTLYASERIHAAGGRISADVYGVVIDSEEDQQIVGQNYVEMSRSLDAISPMIYPSHYGPYNYQIPVPDAQPYDTVLAAMQASKMVLAGLDPKTGKKPVSADVSGNDAVDAAIAGGEAVSGNNAADAAADSKSTSGTTAVSGNDAAQDAEDAQAADGAQAAADAQAAEDAAAKTFALSKEEIAQLDPTTGVQATVRPWLQDFTATWVKGHISYGPEEIRAQIQAVYDAGYEEWILWNAANRYTEGGLLTQEEEQ
ncbi:putative glycoside hydrolase [Gallintestinimicrobium sp.]|uniref:putative glycoside hydrolase n=1 Tax=Gallintestinimicrobium sp. TaxID=2981655 RepID=UPI00307CA32B